MKGKITGIIILLLVMAGGLAYKFILSPSKPQVILKGYVGGEKVGLLEDQDVKKILKSRYGITIDYSKAGSIEMVEGSIDNIDFLFPSSQTALEIFKELKGSRLVKSEIVLNSPIVFFSWDNVTDALIKQGIVQKTGDTYYIVDTQKFIGLIAEGRKWSDIGLPELYGKVTVICTDPTKSNSGNMFAGLLASMINNGDVVDEESVEKVLPQVKAIFSKLGYLPSSSGDLFEQYLRTGEGANPIIVGYENQLVEFAKENPEVWKNVKNRIRILYPTPTVWSAHPVMLLNSKGSALIAGLEDREIQKIAWEKHGFRTGLAGVQNDPGVLGITGIPQNINKVIPVPKANVMEMIINALK